LPKILFAKGLSVGECVDELRSGVWTRKEWRREFGNPMQLWVERVRRAVEVGDLRSLCALLDRGPMDGAVGKSEALAVVREKFPRKEEGECGGGVVAERRWVERWRKECGGVETNILSRQIIRWARAKREKAADLGGWSGRFILEVATVDISVVDVLAKLWSMDPKEWRSEEGVMASWRSVKGCFIPQVGKGPRPVATPPVARRAWGGRAVKLVKDEVSRYCEERGQFGLSSGGGIAAYSMTAAAFARMGATILVDDRRNSYHEIHRSAVYDGVTNFLTTLSAEKRSGIGRVLVDLVDRTFTGGKESGREIVRSTYHFAVLEPRTHWALVQGSPESAMLEALVYCRAREGDAVGRVRCELHDDGWCAIMVGSPLGGLARQLATDGSRFSDEKECVVGPRAGEAVAAGLARRSAEWTMIAGVPVGDEGAGLRRWRERFRARLGRLRELSMVSVKLAVAAMAKIGGPAGLATHILRALPGHQEFWGEVDEEWVEAWCDMMGVAMQGQGRDRMREVMRNMGHHFAAEVAEARYAAGVADAAMRMDHILGRAGMKMDRRWWRAIGVEEWHPGGREWGPLVLREAAMRVIRGKEDAAPRVKGLPNLWEVWAASTAPESATTLGRADELVGMRRLLGISVVGERTFIVQPKSCVRCGAPSTEAVEGGGRRCGPRAILDDGGEHALTCVMGGGDVQRRHNTVAYAIRDCLREAGWVATCASGQVFDAHKGRPADVWVEGHPRHRGGLAVDCTVVSTAGQEGARAVERKERMKEAKYGDEVARHPGLGFEAFALGLDGTIGPKAWVQMQEWARVQAVRGVAGRNYGEALDWVSRTIAHAFVAGTVRQIRSFYDRSDRWRAEGCSTSGDVLKGGGGGSVRYVTDTRQGTSGTSTKSEKVFSTRSSESHAGERQRH